MTPKLGESWSEFFECQLRQYSAMHFTNVHVHTYTVRIYMYMYVLQVHIHLSLLLFHFLLLQALQMLLKCQLRNTMNAVLM